MRWFWIVSALVLLACAMAWSEHKRLGRGVQVVLWVVAVLAAFAVGFTN